MSVYNIFILLVFNRECMEHNVMISFRILSSFECFLCYFQTRKTTAKFDWQKTGTHICQVAMFAISQVVVSSRTMRGGRGEWSFKCGQAWNEGGGVLKIPKYVWTPFMDDPLHVASTMESQIGLIHLFCVPCITARQLQDFCFCPLFFTRVIQSRNYIVCIPFSAWSGVEPPPNF